MDLVSWFAISRVRIARTFVGPIASDSVSEMQNATLEIEATLGVDGTDTKLLTYSEFVSELNDDIDDIKYTEMLKTL